MPKWTVAQWGDGSQKGQDKWNIFVPAHEAAVGRDLPLHVADYIADSHNAEVAELEAELASLREAALNAVEYFKLLGLPHPSEAIDELERKAQEGE